MNQDMIRAYVFVPAVLGLMDAGNDSRFDKQASDDLWFGKDFALETFRNDPFLPRDVRKDLMKLTNQAPEVDGMTRPGGLMRSAVQLGVDFGTAYLFGNAVGRLLSFSPSNVRKLSIAGGLATAVVGSGILSKLSQKRNW